MITPLPLPLLLLSLLSLSSPTSSITLPLSKLHKINPPPQGRDIYDHLSNLASDSLARAHRLKNQQKPAPDSTPLSPRSYGGYSVSLAFGTPPRTLPFVMDTGSSLVWFPCTSTYICKDCDAFSPSPSNKSSAVFVPRLSSTAKIVGCLNPKCGWVHGNKTAAALCPPCADQGCPRRQEACPAYIVQYGSGSTGGIALLDTLHVGSRGTAPGFLAGCSLFSDRQPSGVAGFGRGPASIPSQLGLRKFSYCLVSHRLDDADVTSPLDLTRRRGQDDDVEPPEGVSYTKFSKNPRVKAKEAYSEYYYLGLREILVGGKRVRASRGLLTRPDPVTGSGGTIVDSGTTFTYMGREVFEPVARAMEAQARGLERAEGVEGVTGLRPCFNVSGVLKTVSLPSLVFRYKGGAEMVFPLENYFSLAGGGADAVCFTVVTDPPGREGMGGPKVILGNYQQQNYYVEYDLRNNRFGFRQQKCG